ncbi:MULTISPECIES: hypothetical protein [Streptomyces]|nr:MULTISPECIES: hypothetical protein [Streptomyces]
MNTSTGLGPPPNWPITQTATRLHVCRRFALPPWRRKTCGAPGERAASIGGWTKTT